MILRIFFKLIKIFLFLGAEVLIDVVTMYSNKFIFLIKFNNEKRKILQHYLIFFFLFHIERNFHKILIFKI